MFGVAAESIVYLSNCCEDDQAESAIIAEPKDPNVTFEVTPPKDSATEAERRRIRKQLRWTRIFASRSAAITVSGSYVISGERACETVVVTAATTC